MAFNRNWDVADVISQLRRMLSECASPYNDGFTSSCCKQDLYQVKCFIEDNWEDLPVFPEHERRWEQQRIIQRLKR